MIRVWYRKPRGPHDRVVGLVTWQCWQVEMPSQGWYRIVSGSQTCAAPLSLRLLQLLRRILFKLALSRLLSCLA
jgi:hypothetical protein